MKLLRVSVVVTAVLLLLAPLILIAQRPLTLGTGAPPNSIWDRALKGMADDVQKTTNRRIRFRVAARSQGGESAIVRRLALGTTQAAALTLPTLSGLADAFKVFGMPFFLESDDETRHVLEVLRPMLEQGLARHDLVLLNWGHVGQAHLFSADPIDSVQDIKNAKLWTSAGDDTMVRWYRQHGFDPVPLDQSDVPIGLNTGLINAYPFPPYAALLLQYYRAAPFMLDMPLTLVVGATVMTSRSWERLSEEDRDTIRAAGQRVEQGLFRDVPRLEAEAVEEMQKRGLDVVRLDQAAQEEFRREADEMNASMRGTIVPAAVYDQAVRARDEFRSR